MQDASDDTAAPVVDRARPRPRGRPRAFDRDAALDRAMMVFWEKGYEAASLAELTAAMGINPPSLYAAFGDKQRLFLEAIDRYTTQQNAPLRAALEEAPTARDGVAALFRHIAAEWSNPCHPRGCMVVTAAATCMESTELQDIMARKRAETTEMLRLRILRGMAEGDVPPQADATALADFYTTIFQGLTLQARDGAGLQAMQRTATLALCAWPRFDAVH